MCIVRKACGFQFHPLQSIFDRTICDNVCQTYRRLIVFTVPNITSSKKEETFGADKFLKLDLPDRLDFIQKEFLPARVGGKDKNKTKSDIINFVIDLEKTLRANINMGEITKDEELALRELEKVQRYLQNPRSSNRLILEHLALTLPL